MLSPSEYEHLCDQLITLYDDLDNAIINDMVKRMMKTGKVTEATAWQAKQLQQSGMLYEDILEEIAKRTNATRNQVRTLFEDAGVQSVRNDNRSYKAAGLETIVKMSDAALQTLNAGYKKCMGDLSNLTLTTANTSQTAYIKACNLAYMEVTSGTMDYGTAIRRAVKSAADEGSWILYPSGHRDRLDVAVRRSVLTGVGQTVRKISEINANDMDCDIMEITAHAGARPSHAEWQGQFASLSGKNAGRKIDGARVYSLKEIGYGTGDGFGGWNCRHDWFPFFEGISSRAYSNQRLKDLNARNIEYNGKMYSEYEIDQMQRALERKVRERKRAVSAADTAVKNAPDNQTANQMKAFFTEQSVKLKQAEKNLSDFISATGNLPDGTRTWVNGFGRSTAQKAVWANRKAQPQPHMAAIPKNNNKNNSGNNISLKSLTNPNNSGKIKSGNNSSGKFDFPVRPLSENARLFHETYIEQYAEKFPKYAEALVSRFNNGSEKVQNLFLDNVRYDSIADTSLNGEDSYFNPDNKKIYMNFTLDFALNGGGKGIGTVFFHEHGHLIDNALDDVSVNNKAFYQALQDDFIDFKNRATGMPYKELFKTVSEQLKNLRTDNGVSDIINGLSYGAIKGCSYHDKYKDGSDYWSDRTICQEAFAHMFEAQFDRQKYERMKLFFPKALEEFENMLRI